MYRLIRSLLFRLDAEDAHNLTLGLLQRAGGWRLAQRALARWYAVDDPRLEVEVFGLRFRNPVGLAAGYDKNGVALAGLAALGFGHLEVGTLTPQPQAGNPRPRVHRFPAARAVVNSMGFPNRGIAALPEGLATTHSAHRLPALSRVRVGINLGKGKDTPLERAAEDYCALLRHVHAHQQADYAAINISSPNTPGLRQLQAQAAIEALLRTVAAARDALVPRLPLLVKIAPDLSDAEIAAMLEAIALTGVDGIIATNTTTSRADLPAAAALPGGLSGAPLRARSTEVIRAIAARTQGRLPIIGVGGIANAADALEKLRAGASLVQVYTGLVYTGPGLIRSINRGLLRACDAAGAASVRDLAAGLTR